MEIVRDVPRAEVDSLQAELLSEVATKRGTGHQGITEVYASKPCAYIVARDAGKAVGVATVSFLFGDPELHKLFVSSGYRSQGVSKLLFAEALRYCAELGHDEMFAQPISQEGLRFLNRMSVDFAWRDWGEGALFKTS